tara:strand:+ start:14442 stop:15002 length:561 start_codon:yes stop_codon:yes gene_type:complete
MRKSVVLVAKGPSASFANSFIQDEDDIAVVNDAGAIVNRKPDYQFFSDLNDPTMEQAKYASACVSPLKELNKLPPALTHITYADTECGSSVESFIERIASGGICHHHTTTGAIHWLCKFGKYSHVRIIGIDGGSGVADGVFSYEWCYSDIAKVAGDDFLDEWKGIDKSLCSVMEKVYGVSFEWYRE